MSEKAATAQYNAGVFEVRSIEEAKRIALTAEDTTTEQRWRVETPYLGAAIAKFLEPGKDSLVLDYGCGIGRMAKELIERCDCSVIGVDISLSMRQLGPAYVGSGRFAACSWAVLESMIEHGLRADGAIAIWSLQHSPRVEDDVARLDRALKPGAGLFVCNINRAAVPTDRGWLDTGFDIKALLANAFEEVAIEPVAEAHTSEAIAAAAFLGKYRKRDG